MDLWSASSMEPFVIRLGICLISYLNIAFTTRRTGRWLPSLNLTHNLVVGSVWKHYRWSTFLIVLQSPISGSTRFRYHWCREEVGLRPPKDLLCLCHSHCLCRQDPLAAHEGPPPPGYTYQSCASSEVFTRCLPQVLGPVPFTPVSPLIFSEVLGDESQHLWGPDLKIPNLKDSKIQAFECGHDKLSGKSIP